MEAGIAARPSGASSADRMPADPPSRRPPTSQMDDTGAGEWPSGTRMGGAHLLIFISTPPAPRATLAPCVVETSSTVTPFWFFITAAPAPPAAVSPAPAAV